MIGRAPNILVFALAVLASSTGCRHAAPQVAPVTGASEHVTLARIYYWRARPGQFDSYTRYVRDVAEPIDHEAQRAGAFMSITTFITRDASSPWSHMRVFLLRDSTQLAGLGAALDAAGVRVQPDSIKRKAQSDYAATLRDRVGDATVEVLP